MTRPNISSFRLLHACSCSSGSDCHPFPPNQTRCPDAPLHINHHGHREVGLGARRAGLEALGCRPSGWATRGSSSWWSPRCGSRASSARPAGASTCRATRSGRSADWAPSDRPPEVIIAAATGLPFPCATPPWPGGSPARCPTQTPHPMSPNPAGAFPDTPAMPNEFRVFLRGFCPHGFRTLDTDEALQGANRRP